MKYARALLAAARGMTQGFIGAVSAGYRERQQAKALIDRTSPPDCRLRTHAPDHDQSERQPDPDHQP